MNHQDKINTMLKVEMLDIIEYFKNPAPDRDLDEFDDEEDQFFHAHSEILNKLGVWILEILGNEDKLLSPDYHVSPSALNLIGRIR